MNTRSASIPHMPARNPYLTDSVYPISHFNPAATDSVAHAGPTKGRLLTAKDITVIPNLFVSGPTVKREGDATIVIAPRSDGLPRSTRRGMPSSSCRSCRIRAWKPCRRTPHRRRSMLPWLRPTRPRVRRTRRTMPSAARSPAESGRFGGCVFRIEAA